MVAAVNRRLVALAVFAVFAVRLARADSLTPIPADEDGFSIDAVKVRLNAFDQRGQGYQSQASKSVLGPGSERLTVFEPQLEVTARQGAHLHHRLAVPIDVVTSASADALDRTRVDTISSASRHNEAGTIDWTSTYDMDSDTQTSLRGALHLEEDFRSWLSGIGIRRAFGSGATSLAANLLEVYDWFDRFDIRGYRSGRANRATTTATLGFTQLVTATTAFNVNYGYTLQLGELGNTWNSVPLGPSLGSVRGPELLPDTRSRHALVGRVSQYLPWNGALRLSYRLYGDDWGLAAHSIESQLSQRLHRSLYVAGLIRYHIQTAVDFYTQLASVPLSFRNADSDLESFHAWSLGGKIVWDIGPLADLRGLHFDVGAETYARSNGLTVNVVTWETGYRF